MDILKLLSRGTKKSALRPPQVLPATQPPNPQLYHDPTRGTKRKRDDEQQPAPTVEPDDDLDINFFAPKPARKPIPELATTHAPEREAVPATPALDDEQVREILKSHRLKFTLLSSLDYTAKKVEKPGKKKKKREARPKTKDGKKQLFPRPLTSFSELRSTYNISTRLGENLSKQGYRIPTEVQLGSLPLLLEPERAIPSSAADQFRLATEKGVNFLAVAPTGSGKTVAFLIPAIDGILRRKADDVVQKERVLEVVVVAPTRELGHQIVNEGRKLAQGTGVKIVGMKKGMQIPVEGQSDEDPSDKEENSQSDPEADHSEDDEDHGGGSQSASTTTKTDILVTTPLLLRNFLKSRKLPTVKSLILDEADALLDPLFRDQTLGIWSACTNKSLRLTCWSATMGSNIEGLILEQVESREPDKARVPLIRLVVGIKDTAVPSITHKLIYTATEQGKLFALRQLLHPKTSDDSLPKMRLPFLVFTQTIERATALHSELKFDIAIEAGGSSRITVLHSSLSDSARAGIVARFRAGEIWVLITTDLLMRGIDFRGVNGVINYDVPTSAAAYVHRVGRTGRAGHGGGVAVTLYTTEDVAYLKNIANVVALSEKQAGKGGGEGGIPKWLMDSLPKVRKEEKQRLKQRGVESRRGSKTKITSKSAWERRKEHNRRGAIAGSKKRKLEAASGDTREADDDDDDDDDGDGDGWSGIGD
ncbi:P-loop containing nucleoside triphosphate hydrolase protein [Durotheca rogersii]|uniref:P-loop containing nucleoside triphosphate hydrolase protein n=1 Tax=Durotheca rogersii TaxID=419775 RepID=UPI0022210C7A|nr:P-loop containing nucleoside triphosphate hydrolase protein [Durotheca rogersii]KAI5859641.1 P-loop containing nucleoside triphosphate hydrolase protein [Durotheca rogersii]